MDLSDKAVRKEISQIADAVTGTHYCWDCQRHRSARVFSRAPAKGKRRKCDDCWSRVKGRQRIQIAPSGQVSKLPPARTRLIIR